MSHFKGLNQTLLERSQFKSFFIVFQKILNIVLTIFCTSHKIQTLLII